MCFRCRLARQFQPVQPLIYAKLNIVNEKNVVAILNRLPLAEKTDLCRSLNLCVPGVYPYLFNFRLSGKIKHEIAVRNPFRKLRQYLKTKNQIILPKFIKITNQIPGITLYFGPEDTKPTRAGLSNSNLDCVELDNIWIIRKKNILLLRKESTTNTSNLRTDQNNALEPETLETNNNQPGHNTFNQNTNRVALLESSNLSTTDADDIQGQGHQNVDRLRLEDSTLQDGVSADIYDPPLQDEINNNAVHTGDINGQGNEDGNRFMATDSGVQNSQNSMEQHGHSNDSMHFDLYGGGPDDGDNSDDGDDGDDGDEGSDGSRGSSFDTIPKDILRNHNLFLTPEKSDNQSIMALIHITKEQFIEFCDSVDDNHYWKTATLTKFSQGFLFRLKLASNWSFQELGTVFGIDVKMARRIFWKLVQSVYMTGLALPKILTNDEEFDQMFQQVYTAQDPFFTELFGAFKDPQGILSKLQVRFKNGRKDISYF